ncbi:MAG TPA: ACS family MFS transporter [Candidatus Binataceae bacterium]|nr:ACS family MFS transporter [Candidatus Binataceae bacterium]
MDQQMAISSINIEAPHDQGWPRRYTVIVLFALGTALCYIDRVNISIAIIPLAADKGYDAAAQGLVLSSFFWGYIWLQMLGGWLADRFGGKRVLMAGVAIWSLATALTPPAASISFGALLVTRALLGAGEGLNFPAVHSVAARWTLVTERARAIAFHFSGLTFGTIVALLVSPAIVIDLGWPSVFYISGALGLVWLAAWYIKAADAPEDCPGVSAHELATIAAGRPEMPLAGSIPWAAILHEPAVWAIVIAHLCNNFGFYIILLWLPSYLSHTFQVPMARLGELSVIPYAVAFVMQNASGWFADTLQKRGMSLTAVRKSMQTAAFAAGAIPLIALPAATSAGVAVTLVTLSIGGSSLGVAAFAVNHLDVAPRYAGILMGLSNTFATIPGIVGVAATGFILQKTNSFAAAFYLTAVVYAIGMVCYLAIGSGDRKI